MHTSIHAYMHTCIHAYMHTCIHAYMHTCIHAYMHTCIHAYMHTCIHAYIYRISHRFWETSGVSSRLDIKLHQSRLDCKPDKMLQKKLPEPVAVPLDSLPERCTMTMKRKISTRASFIPILRLGPLLLSDTCNPQQAVRERNVGP